MRATNTVHKEDWDKWGGGAHKSWSVRERKVGEQTYKHGVVSRRKGAQRLSCPWLFMA